jgi:TRAP-type C4-dicarboxylate transport system permease large subunit
MLSDFVSQNDLSPLGLVALVVGVYVVIGCVMEPMPLMIITVPTLTPVMSASGFDPVWFGILIVLLSETAMITPPIGTNLFVVQGVRGRGPISDVMVGAGPFVVVLLVMIALIIAFPEIVLWLPQIAK